MQLGNIQLLNLLQKFSVNIQHHELQPIRGSLLQVSTFIFLGEMILKLIAFKFRDYIKSRWNIFDGLVVVISLVDTVLTLSNLIDNTGTSVLRSFRLVSILIKSLKIVKII